MITYVLLSAVVILMCIILNKVSNKLGIPMLLAFIVLGMLFGSDGIFKIHFDNYTFTEQICSIALIFIMFYGGFGTKWKEAKPIAVKALLLSTIGVILTAGITGMFCYSFLNFSFLDSLLIGAVISSTDAASVFSILRSKKLNLKENTASLLEVESGSNDPCSYMLTIVILSIMGGNISSQEVVYMLFSQIVYAVIVGGVIAWGALYVLKKHNFLTDGFDTIFVFAVALLGYATPTLIGGNGYLSVYIVGIILGNARIKNKKTLVHFFDGVTGLMQMLIFFSLGLLSFPSQIPNVLLPALAIAVFLTFVARPIAVFSILTPSKSTFKQQLLVSWAGLRGAASIVFAIMATTYDAATNNNLFHIVFCIVLISILIQGTLIPKVAKRLNMIDNEENVLKTFNDYSEEDELQLIKLEITKGHSWNNKKIRDIILPPETLLVLVLRNENLIIPKGKTIILENDILVLSAPSFNKELDLHLRNIKISKENTWNNKMIKDLECSPHELIIMIKRGEKSIIPNGKTIIEQDDIIVMSST